jgi:hypothetical protein
MLRGLTQESDLMNLLLLFQNKESELKMGYFVGLVAYLIVFCVL